MSVDLQLERLYDRIKLVSGAGKPGRGKLCIMSFVAYLAGEPHGDRPETASSIIRNFAIRLNDGVGAEWRQELKPFAPRIIGTNDGEDRARSEMLLRTMVDEVLPRARAEQGRSLTDTIQSANPNTLSGPYTPHDTSDVRELLAHLTYGTGFAFDQAYPLLGTWAGNLIVILLHGASTQESRRWYWNKGVELLDRLCDVGVGARVPQIRLDRIERMQTELNRQRVVKGRFRQLLSEVARAKRAIPDLYRSALHH